MPSVLVTGAGRGIGLAVTQHMSERGWDVYATARSDADLDRLDRLSRVHAIPLEITDRSSLAGLSERLPAKLDGVVNSAGIHREWPCRSVVARRSVAAARRQRHGPDRRDPDGAATHTRSRWTDRLLVVAQRFGHPSGERRLQRIEIRVGVVG